MMNVATMPPEVSAVNQSELEIIAEKGRQAIVASNEARKTELKGNAALKLAAIRYLLCLVEGRRRHSSKNAFHEWVTRNGLDAYPYDDRRVRTDALKIGAISDDESILVIAFGPCPVAHLTNMRVWAYKTGLIKPRLKPPPRMVVLAPPQIKTLQQLRREAAIVAGETVSPLALDQETKDKIDEDAKERADQLELKDAEKHKFEKIIRDALRKVIQEGRSYKEKCDVEQRRLINQEVERRVALTESRLQKEKDEAEKFRKHYEALIDRHKPIFTIDTFRVILRGLHEDSTSPDNRRDAFSVFNAQKFRLTGVK